MSNDLSAGTAIVGISPPEGLRLRGYPRCPGCNTGRHDPLPVSCLVLEDGRTPRVCEKAGSRDRREALREDAQSTLGLHPAPTPAESVVREIRRISAGRLPDVGQRGI